MELGPGSGDATTTSNTTAAATAAARDTTHGSQPGADGDSQEAHIQSTGDNRYDKVHGVGSGRVMSRAAFSYGKYIDGWEGIDEYERYKASYKATNAGGRRYASSFDPCTD